MAETIRKGDLGQAVVMADLLKRGHKIAVPYGQDFRYDLILIRDGKFERVQVKHLTSNGIVLHVRVRSCSEWKVTNYTAKDFEWLAVYDSTTGRIFYLKNDVWDGMTSLDLRYIGGRQGQGRSVENFVNI